MLNFDGIRVLTFDCYGTLVNWEAGILSALRPSFANRGIEISNDDLLEAYGQIEAQLESGPWKPYRQVLRECVAGLGLRYNFSPTALEMDALPASLPFWPIFPDTMGALRRLKTRFQLAVISNTDDDLFATTARNLRIEFDAVVTAERCQSYKPSENNFRRAIEKIGVRREEILHVAQSIYHDIVPARALGLSSVWINRRKGLVGSGATLPANGSPDLEVPDLKSLADLLLETATIQ